MSLMVALKVYNGDVAVEVGVLCRRCFHIIVLGCIRVMVIVILSAKGIFLVITSSHQSFLYSLFVRN